MLSSPYHLLPIPRYILLRIPFILNSKFQRNHYHYLFTTFYISCFFIFSLQLPRKRRQLTFNISSAPKGGLGFLKRGYKEFWCSFLLYKEITKNYIGYRRPRCPSTLCRTPNPTKKRIGKEKE